MKPMRKLLVAATGRPALLEHAQRDRSLAEGKATRPTRRKLAEPRIGPRADPEALERLRALEYVE